MAKRRTRRMMEKESTSDMPVRVKPLKTAWLNVVIFAVAQLDQIKHPRWSTL